MNVSADSVTTNRASGHQADAAFADAFIKEFRKLATVVAGVDGHWRPTASLAKPLGKVDGDVACVCRLPDAEGDVLVVVEREGSAPGNERNILKWYRAIVDGPGILLKRGAETEAPRYTRVFLLLAFGRSEKWGDSDFKKTAAFCRFLGETLSCRVHELPFHVEVVESDTIVEDWPRFGAGVAKAAADLLSATYGSPAK